jgi:predicted transposase YbfD/YdcC
MTLVAQNATDIDAGHGRVETRRCWVANSIDWLPQRGEWKGIRSVICIESIREVAHHQSHECHYYLTSLNPDPILIQKAVRQHWTIENSLHWTLDMTFLEDASRIRKDHAPENLSFIRKVALSWLKNENSKRSIRSKRKKVGWDHSFLSEVVFT